MKYLKKILAISLIALAIPAVAQTPRFIAFTPKGPFFLPFAAAGTSTNYSTLQAIEVGGGYTGTNGFFFIDHYVQTNSTSYPPVSGLSPVYLQGNPFNDVSLWANRDGTAPLANFSISVLNQSQAGGAATNIIKVTLYTLNRLSDSPNNALGAIYNNQSLDSFTFTVTNTQAATSGVGTAGYDQITMSTNIPQTFLQGALGLQVQLNIGPIGTNGGTAYWTNVTGPYNALVTNTVSGWQIQSIGISGFTPSASP